MPKLAISLLGTPRLERDGIPVEVDTRKAIALLAYLVVTDQAQARDTLATLLWPENDQSRARASLRRTLSALNKALGRYGLDIQREVVGIASDADIWLDVNQFQQLLSAVDKHNHSSDGVCPTCLPLLEKAVELYLGDFMTGFTLRDSPGFDDWQFFQGESLRRELAGALEKLVTSHSARGDYPCGIEFARRWLALDPLLERAHRHLMLLYAWSDQRNAALRQYRECVRILEEELGVTPLEKTTLLYQAILENAHPPKPTLERPVEIDVLPSLQEKPSFKREHAYPLVGRQLQWQVLIDAYRKSQEDSYFLILNGETGIGKTRLALEFLNYVQSQGGATIFGSCHEGETHLAYGPFLTSMRIALESHDSGSARLEKLDPHWLSEAARLLPEIKIRYPELPPLPPIDGPGAQSRFFESLRRVLLALLYGRTPGIFFLDDLQWSDTASLDLLTYLARRLHKSGLFILGTWNTDMAVKNPHLDRVIVELQQRGRASQLTLSRLKDKDITELVTSLDAIEPGSKELISQQLYHESEGLPFLTIEYIKTILEGNKTAPSANWDMPASVREVLRSRVTLIDETARQLLSTAAIMGGSFDFNTLREASGRSEAETVSGLESLLAHGLIVEREASQEQVSVSYSFTHDKLRQVTLEEISLTRRRLLHRRVAEALISPARRQPEPIASLAAYHFQRAGHEDQAAAYYKLAGEHARELYANVDALAHFQAALALGHPETAELHEAVGDLYTLQGEYIAAIASYQKAAALCKPACLNALEHKLGNVHHRLGNWDLAECHYMAALDVSEEEKDPVELSKLYADLSRTAHQQNRLARAMEMAHLSLELAEETKNQSALAQAQNILGVLARRQGNPSQAIRHLWESLETAERLPNPEVRVAALNNLALAYVDNDQLGEAKTLTEEALGICVQIGDRHRQAALHNNLADLLHTAGQEAESMAELKKAVVIFAEIGVDAGSKQAEIWKLTEW